MKTHIISLLGLLVLTACTVPGPSDFEPETKPLSEDEFIVVWRFSRLAADIEVLDKSQDHKVKMEAAMAPLFQQLIPQIFSDIKEGKLVIREEEDITDLDENPIKDVPSRLNMYNESSWQDITPFMQVFHLTQRRNVFTAGFPAAELELELIGQDPNGKFNESGLGSIRVDDLIKLGYFIEVEGQTYDLITYLDKTIKFAYPISYFYKNNENGLRTLEEAFGTKKFLLEGKWLSIPWIVGEANLTGMKSIPLPIPIFNQYIGEYSFQVNQGSSWTQKESPEPITATISLTDNSSSPDIYYFYPKENFLRVMWSNQAPSFSMFPTSEQSFFTTTDDRIFFGKMEDGRMKVTLRDSQGIETIGYKE